MLSKEMKQYKMERVNKIMNLTTLMGFIFLVALVPKMESQNMNSSAVAPITQRPLCASQFALANYACVKLPFSPGSPPEPPPDSPPSPDDDGGDDNDDGGDDSDDDGGGDDNDDDDDDHHHDDDDDDDHHHHDDDDDDHHHHDDDDDDHHHHDDDDDHHHHRDHKRRRRHGHRHRHRHRNGKGAEEEECCRWAKEVDSQCVCELLVRLPPFLMRPVHQYSLDIGDNCHVTYSCGAPI